MNRSTRMVLAIILSSSGPGWSQAPRSVPRSFEVASIRPNQTDSESRRAAASPGGKFNASNVTLKLLIARALGVAEFQIERGPSWIDTEKYDIAARADTPLELTREELRPCLQTLLEERFRLKFHHQPKEGSVFSLALSKNGPRFKEHQGGGAPGISASSGSGEAEINGTRATMARLAEYLSGQAGRPVIDNTGLKGEYDFNVKFSTEQTSSEPSNIPVPPRKNSA